jgi:hypothetical protein
MLITFRQGIVSVQASPSFLSFTGTTVNLNANVDPTQVAFADGSSDYLYTENESVPNAWPGPYVSGTDYWLYWDLNTVTGVRTFGRTTIEPEFGNTLPASPPSDKHFFLVPEAKMKVWNGSKWVDRIRVFAGKVENGGVLIPETTGTQVAINQNREAGAILFDDTGNAIKRNNGEFLTSATPLSTQESPLNSFKLEATLVRARSNEPIPKYHCVAWKGPNILGLASSAIPKFRCIGIALEDFSKGDVKRYTTSGFVVNEAWNFTEPPGTLLFVGKDGAVTTTVPQRISMQRVGIVVDANTALISIDDLFLIDAEPTVTPTVTPTPSGV